MLPALQPLFPQVDLQVVAVFLILVGVVVAFFREWGSPDLVAIAALGVVLLLGIVPLEDVTRADGSVDRGLLSVFSNGAPITIACMFVLSAGLERTGAIEVMGRFFSRVAGRGELRVLLVLLLTGAILSAFVNNTPVVVVFLPIVLAHARATGLKASKLLIPLSYASILGGTCTLIGTSTNLIIDGVAQDYGQPAFGMFEMTGLGIVYALIGFIYLLTMGRNLLPDRSTLSELIDSASSRQFLTQFQVEPGSSLVGKPLTETLLVNFPKAQVLEVKRRGRVLQDPLDRLDIRERDRLLITLHGTSFERLRKTEGIGFEEQQGMKLKKLEDRELTLIEAIVGARSSLIGRTVKEIGFRRHYGINVLAMHRQGENLGRDLGSLRLQFGDTLLLEGSPDAISEIEGEELVTRMTDPPKVRVDPVKVWFAVGIAIAFVLGASLKVMAIPALAILAAIGMILLRCLTAQQAYEAVQWNIVFLIFGMLALGLAMDQSGAARHLVDGVLAVFGGFSPLVVLSVIYLLSSILTEIISNNAVAALLTPIVIGIAAQLEVDARPFIVALMFGCSASFATPIGYQTNTYVFGAGGYRFSDFPRVGLPLNLILWVVATCLVPLLWPFYPDAR